MHQAIISRPDGRPSLAIDFSTVEAASATVGLLKQRLEAPLNLPIAQQRLTSHGGLPLTDANILFQNEDTRIVFLHIALGLDGGKGGFGSELRKMGARLASKRATNFDSCRDLNGRRLKTVKKAKELADYAQGETGRKEAEREKIRKKIEKGLKEPPTKKHRFDDPTYFKDSERIQEDIRRAVQASATTSTSALTGRGKEPTATAATSSALAMWDGDYGDLSSSSDEEGSDSRAGDIDDIGLASTSLSSKHDKVTPATSAGSDAEQDVEAVAATATTNKGKNKGKKEKSETVSKGKEPAKIATTRGKRKRRTK